jgi:hypothetical protein
MKSPFPGMDPYLERHWRDVHHRLCTYACDELQPQVQPALLARIDERLVVEADYTDPRSIYPDVKVVEDQPAEGAAGGGTAVLIEVDEPLLIASGEPATEGFVQIIDPSADGRIVTVIEFLSMTNKTPGGGKDDYRRKMTEAVAGGASLVEIDLLRTGDWVVQVPFGRVPKKFRQSYKVCVRRAWETGWEFYPMPLNARLSKIRIPLRQQDRDAVLDLQLLLDRAYQNGAYHRLHYETPLDPPFDPTTAAWAASLVKKNH